MRTRVGLAIVGAAAAASVAFAVPTELSEEFERPPVETKAGDLLYRDFVFWRDRNPNGMAQSLRRESGSRPGALRLGVAPGLYAQARRGDAHLCDRAELREAPERQLAYGTPVWYGFSLRLPEANSGLARRVVVAQVKSPATHLSDPSPIFALRLAKGRLHATIEFERTPGDDGRFRPRLGEACEAGWVPAYLHRDGQVRVMVASGKAGAPAPASHAHCTDAVAVEALAVLPRASKRWVDLVVHVSPGPGGDGRVAIYADGKLVAQAVGRIGHRMEAGRQFFKIGPYRDRDSTALAVDIDSLRRGSSLEAVGPRPVLN
jgi:hypothetical protein